MIAAGRATERRRPKSLKVIEMGRIAIAFRAFFAALLDRAKAERLEAALRGDVLPKIDRVEKPPQAAGPAATTAAGSQ